MAEHDFRVEILPALGQLQPNSPTSGRLRAKFGRNRGENGRSCPSSAKHEPNLVQIRPNLQHHGSKMVEHGSQIRPVSLNSSQTICLLWPIRAKSGRNRPNLVEVGRRLADIGPNPTRFGHDRAKLVELGPNMVEVGQTSIQLEDCLSISGQAGPKPRQIWRPSSRRRRPRCRPCSDVKTRPDATAISHATPADNSAPAMSRRVCAARETRGGGEKSARKPAPRAITSVLALAHHPRASVTAGVRRPRPRSARGRPCGRDLRRGFTAARARVRQMAHLCAALPPAALQPARPDFGLERL